MKEEMRKVYVSNDGTVFLDEKEANNHDREILRTKKFIVSYEPDLTEGRCYYKEGIIQVQADYHHSLFAKEWCNDKFGYKIKYVQGHYSSGTAMAPWSLREVKNDEDVSKYKELKKIDVL